MAGLPFFDSANPGITAPAIEIEITSAGDGGGFGGLADAAASLLGGPAGSPWDEHLVALSLDLGMAPRVDRAELVIAQTGNAPSAALGDRGEIRMGPRGALEALFSGSVVAIERRGDGLRRYRLGNASHRLAQERLNQSVSNMSVQDAIGFAAGALGLALEARVSTSDDPLPQYVFDDSGSVWDHLARLAELRGFSLWCDAADRLQLADQLDQGDSVLGLAYGRDLVLLNLWQRSPHSGAVTVFGGGRTDDGFTLRKQAGPNRATAGDGAPQRFYRHGALLSQADLATRAAGAGLAGHRRTTAGEVVTTGAAALAPGRVVEIEGLPDGGGTFLILAARHGYDHQSGWRTRLTLSDASAPSDLGGLGGLP